MRHKNGRGKENNQGMGMRLKTKKKKKKKDNSNTKVTVTAYNSHIVKKKKKKEGKKSSTKRTAGEEINGFSSTTCVCKHTHTHHMSHTQVLTNENIFRERLTQVLPWLRWFSVAVAFQFFASIWPPLSRAFSGQRPSKKKKKKKSRNVWWKAHAHTGLWTAIHEHFSLPHKEAYTLVWTVKKKKKTSNKTDQKVKIKITGGHSDEQPGSTHTVSIKKNKIKEALCR